MSSTLSAFNWRTGEPSVFMDDGRFTWAAKAAAASARKLGTEFQPYLSNDSINTETADREERPRQRVRALT